MTRTAAVNRGKTNNVTNLGFLIGNGTLPNGQTFPAFWNQYMRPGDLAQTLFAQAGNLSGLTQGLTTNLSGTPQTSVQLTTGLTNCKPSSGGGVTGVGCAYYTWSDETTSTPSQLLNGWVQPLAASTILQTAITTTGQTSVVAQNAKANGFPTTNGFYVLLGSEIVQVIGGAGGNNWVVSRNVNGAGAATYTIGTAILLVSGLNGALANSGAATSVTLRGNSGFTSTGTYTILVDAEQMTVTSGWGTNNLVVIRQDNGTGLAAHNDWATVQLVWNDPGVIAQTAAAHSAGLSLMYSPLGVPLQSSVLSNPLLVSTPDAILFEAQRLEDDATFVNEVVTTVSNIRNASGGKPICVQLNCYDAFSHLPYTPNKVIADAIHVSQACAPDWITFEYLASSEQCLINVLEYFRS